MSTQDKPYFDCFISGFWRLEAILSDIEVSKINKSFPLYHLHPHLYVMIWEKLSFLNDIFLQNFRNVDSVTFAELCEKLTERLQKLEEKKLAQSDFLLPMKNLLSSNDEKENLNKDSDNLNPSQQSDIWHYFEKCNELY